MTARSVTHASFTIDRHLAASPARVFRAFADPVAKKQWFGGPPEWREEENTLDFREGGSEISRGGPKDGPLHTYIAHYYDIVPDTRILYAYEMYLGDDRISVSLASIEFTAADGGTRMLFTEQGAFLEGYDDPAQREVGSIWIFDNLAAWLAKES